MAENQLRIAYSKLLMLLHSASSDQPALHVTPRSSFPNVCRTTAASEPTQVAGRPAFLRSHLVAPIACLLLASVVLIGFHGDFLVADLIYAAQGHAWQLRDNWATTTLVHEAGRNLSAAAWLAVLMGYVWAVVDRRLARWRRPLGYLAAATLIGSVGVWVVKANTGMDCPWDLQRYGGTQPFVALWNVRPAGMPAAACFPAGHASSGFAWVTLYFFFRAIRPQFRWFGLAAALLAGATFGFSQQLRGAHFLSHDLWTLMICWLVALAGSEFFLQANRPGAGA